MNCFRYKMDHDYGFAPNPFHGFLSLATCKGLQLRHNSHLKIGDSVKTQKENVDFTSSTFTRYRQTPYKL